MANKVENYTIFNSLRRFIKNGLTQDALDVIEEAMCMANADFKKQFEEEKKKKEGEE